MRVVSFPVAIGLSLALAAFGATVQTTKYLAPSDGNIISAKSYSPAVNQTALSVVITCRRTQNGHPMGGNVIVLKREKNGLVPLWRHTDLNPWKLTTGDVDGDGRREIIVGVYKKSPKDQFMAKRVFVYGWNGSRMFPKWLGSRLGRRFDDFAFVDINRDHWDELIALEVAPKGKHRVSVYRWKSFGFEWLGATEEMAGLRSVSVERGKVLVTAAKGNLKLSCTNSRFCLIK